MAGLRPARPTAIIGPRYRSSRYLLGCSQCLTSRQALSSDLYQPVTINDGKYPPENIKKHEKLPGTMKNSAWNLLSPLIIGSKLTFISSPGR